MPKSSKAASAAKPKAAPAAKPTSQAIPPEALPEPVTLFHIELATHGLRRHLDLAATTLEAYEAEVAPIRDRYAPFIRRHAAEILSCKERLADLIVAGALLFRSPKTRVLHGIKVGLRKGPDRWAWPTEAALVELVLDQCSPEQQEAYLVTTTVGRKDAIPAAERLRLGIGCTPGADTAVINEQGPATGAKLLTLLAQLPGEEGR